MIRFRIAALCMLSTAALNANTVFFDQTFTSGWIDSVVTNQNMTSYTYVASNPTTGGTGGAGDPYRQETHTMNQNVANTFAILRDFNYNPANTYTPKTQGAIQSLDYTFDLLLIVTPGGAGVGYGLAMEQNGKTYISATTAAGSSSWTNTSVTGRTATDFIEALNSGPYPNVDVNSHPDFSAGALGNAITFGYFVGNSFQFSTSITATSGIDNWNVSLTTATPEPSSALSMATGLGLLLAACKLRRRIL